MRKNRRDKQKKKILTDKKNGVLNLMQPGFGKNWLPIINKYAKSFKKCISLYSNFGEL